jgi:hypothetical protein
MPAYDYLLDVTLSQLDPAELQDLSDRIAAHGEVDEVWVLDQALSYLDADAQGSIAEYCSMLAAEDAQPAADAPLVTPEVLEGLENLPGRPLDDSDEPLSPEDLAEVEATVNRWEQHLVSTAEADGVSVAERENQLSPYLADENASIDDVVQADNRWRSKLSAARAAKNEPKQTLEQAIESAFAPGSGELSSRRPFVAERNSQTEPLEHALDDLVEGISASARLNDLAAHVAADLDT